MFDARCSSTTDTHPLGCGRSVLVVEDNDDIREMLRETLELSGCLTVLVASHGREALDVLRKASPLPAVIVVDLAMPVMSGQEFMAIVRSTPALASIPIIAISASFPAEELPCTVRLRKPVDADELESTIRALCPDCHHESDSPAARPLAAALSCCALERS
jgi:CheY-like chemotaxis protein